MKTPIGTLKVRYLFEQEGNVLVGTATGADEAVPLQGVAVEQAEVGERVTWRQSIKKPMRLNLDFDVTVTGDELNGHSRAGRLPRSTVTGRRVVAS